MVSLINSHANATRIGWHLWGFTQDLPLGCLQCGGDLRGGVLSPVHERDWREVTLADAGPLESRPLVFLRGVHVAPCRRMERSRISQLSLLAYKTASVNSPFLRTDPHQSTLPSCVQNRISQLSLLAYKPASVNSPFLRTKPVSQLSLLAYKPLVYECTFE